MLNPGTGDLLHVGCARVMPEQEEPPFLTTLLCTHSTETPAKPREVNPALPGVPGKPEVQSQIPQPRARAQRNLII